MASIGDHMETLSPKEIVRILMESTFYFDLSLIERRSLLRHILEISSCEPARRQDLIHWI